MTIPFEPPGAGKIGFSCPYCHMYAAQWWSVSLTATISGPQGKFGHDVAFKTALCSRCNKLSLWDDGRMVYPLLSTAPLAHPDLPESVKTDFEEARTILNFSPRAATALLRVCVETLCRELLKEESSKDLNTDIGKLVAKGMPQTIQQALDTLRVVGNTAVHPGTLDPTDTVETAQKLFGLVNMVTEVMITQPKSIAGLYEKTIPPEKKEQINRRDNREGKG